MTPDRGKEEDKCFICNEAIAKLAGNPGRWPLLLPYRGGNGKKRCYHIQCVVVRLEDNSAALSRARKEAVEETEPVMRQGIEVVLSIENYLAHPDLNTTAIVRIQIQRFRERLAAIRALSQQEDGKDGQ